MRRSRGDSYNFAGGESSLRRTSSGSPRKGSMRRKLSQEDVISSVVAVYNQEVERNRVDPPLPTMDLSEIMEQVKEFDDSADKKKEGESVLSTIETLQVIKVQTAEYICVFCKSGEVDDTRLGRLYFRDGVVTHYFCTLFSAALSQGGVDAEGILGFLVNDIMREVRRSFRLKCIYCNKTGASIGCCTRRCKAAYHYACGLEHGVNFQFFGNFQTFCLEHRNLQKLPANQTVWTCTICLCEVGKSDFPNSGTLATCCKNIFHRACLQRMALSAGYFFKCPTCNDSEKFIKEMRQFGIYVPEQDASWEKDNAFQDLYVQYSNCDVTACQCPQGREFNAEKGDWSLARCRLCGGAGTHRKCSGLKTIASWACVGCVEVEKSSSKASISVVVDDQVPTCSRILREAENKKDISHDSEVDDTFVDMSRLIFSRPTSDFFPYTRAKLVAIQKAGKTELPDWRHLTLELRLCDLMSMVVEEEVSEKVALKKPKSKRGQKTLANKFGKRRCPSKQGNPKKNWSGNPITKKRRLTVLSEAKSFESPLAMNINKEQHEVQICETSYLDAKPCTSKSVTANEDAASKHGAKSPLRMALGNKNGSKLSVEDDTLENKNGPNSVILSDALEVKDDDMGGSKLTRSRRKSRMLSNEYVMY